MPSGIQASPFVDVREYPILAGYEKRSEYETKASAGKAGSSKEPLDMSVDGYPDYSKEPSRQLSI